jgi:hypothetical protein
MYLCNGVTVTLPTTGVSSPPPHSLLPLPGKPELQRKNVKIIVEGKATRRRLSDTKKSRLGGGGHVLPMIRDKEVIPAVLRSE